MERIIDIFGNNAEYFDEYSNDNYWFGRLLVQEDNGFEGIVEDREQTKKYFVFGKMMEEQIQLAKCTENDEEIPRIIEVTKTDHNYEGNFKARNQHIEIPLGMARVSLLPSELTRDDSDWEKRQLKLQIIRMKHHLGEIGNKLHEEYECDKAYEPIRQAKLLQKTQNM